MASTNERLVAALDALDLAIGDNVARSVEIRKRLRSIRRQIAAGSPLAPLIEAEAEPRSVELITANIDALHGIGAQLRAAQAQALRDEGLTTIAIADLFGVTRQRVSALLRQKSASTPIGRS